MANNNRCGCGRRASYKSYGCLSCVGGRYGGWENYPYYGGPCPDADGIYDCGGLRENRRDDGETARRCCRDDRQGFGIFSAMLPMAVAANGIIPLVNCYNLCSDNGFAVNCGMITIEKAGTYLATYTVRVPESASVASTFTLNVNDASQSSAITEVGTTAPAGYTAQAIFDACDRCTVALRTSEAISLTDPSTQPLVTLSLVKLD